MASGPPTCSHISMMRRTRRRSWANDGELMAFKVVMNGDLPSLEPVWMSQDMDLPGVAVYANGLIYILGSGDRGATLISRAGGPGGAGGNAPGGGRGAAIGAVIGAGTGAAIASEGDRRRGGYYWYHGGCYIQSPDGWVRVDRGYCY